ncbi:MAG TPA: carbon starvation protein A [Candidatus Flavonifractor merdigallinarum]|uniref:Carbon starvation protein A n=1 Tax=Candidatus Flavonifractor merdigallinarum TaxID=2838589 RepID=A0A9D2BY35_9FIRM|nr:carbon starvation protein A [Candidatus Flavonifractor merdigallinarum]
MISFLIALVLLVVGFFTYGKLIERVFHIDERKTPALAHPDGVDYVPMKTWRVFLIQLLNIAGLGPIYGALAGACWGPKVYLWIVFGTILGGGVHDFLSGMMSERHDGASISEIVGLYMGKVMTFIMRIFSVVLLMMVGVNFSVGPANLIASMTPEALGTAFWLAVILLYYMLATFLPIDKIIGKLYPVFGICLIIMALGVGGAILLLPQYQMPELWDSMAIVHPKGYPMWAMMFVTVACGAVSGFHATQSPMMARCMTSEREGRTIFYGAMVAEGVIALIWAAAGVTFYNGVGPLQNALDSLTQGGVVKDICITLLGPVGGILAIIGVVACPITSGDTAFRSARLTIADWFHLDQSNVGKRAALSVPLLAIGAVIATALPWDILWRYFSWSNQTLAMLVLWTGAVFLHKHGFPPIACLMAAFPATFMSAVSITYFFQASECLNLSTAIAYPVGIVAALAFLAIFVWRTLFLHKDDVNHELIAAMQKQ